MTFIDIKGNTAYLDDVLITCARCGMFHPEYAAKLSEYSIGSNLLLRNPYGALLIKMEELAAQLGLPLEEWELPLREDGPIDRDAFLATAGARLEELAAGFPRREDRRREIGCKLRAYEAAQEMFSHLSLPHFDFNKILSGTQFRTRFGRLPSEALAKLKGMEAKPFRFYKLEAGATHTWCLYTTAADTLEKADLIFAGLGFERLDVPGLRPGMKDSSLEGLKSCLLHARRNLEQELAALSEEDDRERSGFPALYAEAKFLHDCYDLRKYAVGVRDQFHLIGFVQTKKRDSFLQLLTPFADLAVLHEPAGTDPRVPPPVQLKNNWFTRPFEMFVNMYGAPSYNDIDPTPFVAFTYSLLFGIMFGDLGHGLCVSLLGLLVWKWKRLELGRIMARIGIPSMIFGFAYGSVFGFEHLLDPVFHRMGFAEKPIDVMEPGTTNLVLIAAISIGVGLILSVICYNILVGIKQKNWERALLSHNGLCGLVFYGAVLLGAVSTLLGTPMFTTAYVLLLIVLPLALIFLKEPITRLAHFYSKDAIIQGDADLIESTVFHTGTVDLPGLFHSHFVMSRFGRIPTDSYRKLSFYENEPFLLYPLKTDKEYIWLVYAMAAQDKDEIDAIFHDLYFERIYIPDEDLHSVTAAEAYIRRCIEAGGLPEEEIVHEKSSVKKSKRKTIYDHMFPEGFTAFFLETFFELFEVILSFVSNTMSFLRVGGFILIHAGMMSVVFTLSEMIGAGGGVAVIIGGNLFVMALEGLIVGIQVLRLEFYEMFSRFYDAGGEPFQPVHIPYGVPAKANQ